MPTFANISVTSPSDGIAYATNVPLTNNEADLGDGLVCPHPIPVEYAQSIVAIVQMTITGVLPSGSTSYVVMQTDLGDGNWIDVAWGVITSISGTATFLLSSGMGDDAFQQTRTVNTAPSAVAANRCALGGRVRFVGAYQAGNVTSSSGTGGSGITATVKYKMMGLR